MLGYLPLGYVPLADDGPALAAIAGTATITEAADTLTATGALPIVGTLGVTESVDTLSATAALAIAGTETATEEADTLSATGALALLHGRKPRGKRIVYDDEIDPPVQIPAEMPVIAQIRQEVEFPGFRHHVERELALQAQAAAQRVTVANEAARGLAVLAGEIEQARADMEAETARLHRLRLIEDDEYFLMAA